MKFLQFNEPKKETSDEQLFWNNLKLTDLVLHFKLFDSISNYYFKLYPEHTFEDLEKQLRKRGFNTHFVAGKLSEEDSKKYQIKSPSENHKYADQLKYYCLASCKKSEDALKDLLIYSSSYEENLEKLKFTGNLFIDKKETETKNAVEKETEPANAMDENVLKLKENKVELKLSETKDEDFIKNLFVDLQKKHKEIQTKVLNLSKENELDVMCFYSTKNELISTYGFTCDPKTNQYSVVKLQINTEIPNQTTETNEPKNE
jgi:hypothetical protein